MKESAARQLVMEVADVSRETMADLERFAEFLVGECARQNLISSASLASLWSRHILDSAQLIRFAPEARSWLDLGSGAGFPGLVIAMLHCNNVTLVEARPLRCDFLRRAVSLLGLGDRVTIACAKLERVAPATFDAITARAFGPLARLLPLAAPFADLSTRWILPKGKSAKVELEAVHASWQGDFRLEPSLTDADARIIVAERVRRRGKRVG